jgi:hypothetical protein
MKTIHLITMAVLVLLPLFTLAQQKPAPGDNSSYARAYELLLPEQDMQKRARKAVVLLIKRQKN